jgi:hypothetical protein
MAGDIPQITELRSHLDNILSLYSFEMNGRKSRSWKNYDAVYRSAENFKFVHMQCESLTVGKEISPSVGFDE